MSPTRFAVEVNAALPAPLARLAELATNLRFSWHRPTRRLFSALDLEEGLAYLNLRGKRSDRSGR